MTRHTLAIPSAVRGLSARGGLLVLHAAVALQTLLWSLRGPWERLRREEGQTVAEYALVLLVAAAIAGAFLIWARQSGRLDAFFDAIFDRLMDSVDPEEDSGSSGA